MKALNNECRPAPASLYIPLNISLYICLLANILAALFSPIQDCDEVFNYWEPTHYLAHGYGLQTWEYSPEYSIRSWLYISFHAVIAKISSIFTRTKAGQFYFVRLVLALVCTGCEVRLYSAISRMLNPRIGVIFLMVMVLSPGLFHASTALLPSSFAMYTSMVGLAGLLGRKSRSKTARGIMWFGVGAVVGWPFAGALVLPFLLDEIVVGASTGEVAATISGIVDGAARCLAILVRDSFRLSISRSLIHRYCPGMRGCDRQLFLQQVSRGSLEYRLLQCFRRRR